ncbi:MAG: UDP-N-acetylglucosamine--N-acetylmuramyl-(pentapeptide) pyrophosphoryl-undecaprenol N-acetylglucosamine transferase, partial [Deltaproteobacteria bacterium]|nr:UDP-N-acetylglucosamine--N-acetylmuramyl-(pentapeptide) pyrophosphoryl-undecaprenol N-acetylglucosamine transferase [Deltaproteobacteria bacterium]
MNHTKLRFLLTGGGTGGHVTPALAIADELRARHQDAGFLYVGMKGKAEEELVENAGYKLTFVRSKGYPGASNPFSLIVFLFSLGLGILKAACILFRFRPTVIIATGGYVAAPIVLAAGFLRSLGLLRSTIFIHEQNVVPGKLNLLAARFADRVGVSFPESLDFIDPAKSVYVGYPVRKLAMGKDRAAARKKLGIPGGAKVVLAFGGSQGARTINRAVVDALPYLLQRNDIFIIHGTGKSLSGSSYNGANDVQQKLENLGDFPAKEKMAGRYIRKEFFHNIGDYYAACDLVICRAGAGTLTEISACGLPAIIIPKANLPGDHQVANARTLEMRGAAKVLYEGLDITKEGMVESVQGKDLATLVMDLLDSPRDLDNMALSARGNFDDETRERIARVVENMAGIGPKPDVPKIPSKQGDRVLGLSSDSLEKLLKSISTGSKKPLSPGEKRLVEYKIDSYLASSSYVERARGCRMAGWAGYEKRLPMLVHITSKGGKQNTFVEPPIVRRDAFTGIGLMGKMKGDIVPALSNGLLDPYYEARAAAAWAARILARKHGRENFENLVQPLLNLLNDRSFEVKANAIPALSEISMDPKIYIAFSRLYFDPVWKIRQAVFDAFSRLVQRGILEPG